MISDYMARLDDHVKFLHATRQPPFSIHFHLHQGCEIYFLIRGDVNYFVDKAVYPLQHGDLVITNEHEIHKPALTTDAVYERVTIEFDPALIALFQTADMNLLQCFYDRPIGEHNIIKLSEHDQTALSALFAKYADLQKQPFPEAPLLKLGCLLEILVLVQRCFHKNKEKESRLDLPPQLSPILAYLDQHLAEDLSLERLEGLFFISRFHLSRLFKKHTGSTIHEYILYKRIALAKTLLREGRSVTEASMDAGFNDYSGFLRVFKKKVGLLPRQYAKQHQTTAPK
ncbi:AraC family transcriptional regulator [Paenibacillus sacheonensis]|uniref:Helix-turn-helix domain-containing protein n=1 Tax=Paenibacillus sacheonensis TaxID=742054 RepID=A0A7X5BYL2_9BACL|nr:AraC family transcriptional regulator [Paenibacillus sacheonensis]MBM7565503.1 AraC-like DNA-binding protein [Paenibacillus sacheonensis]NBC69571.1 helix-turn-helix domain-containing protein [Paenibacillus sacheonensis]